MAARRLIEDGSGVTTVPLDSVTEKSVEFSTSCALESTPPSRLYVPSYVPGGSVNGLFKVISNNSISELDWPESSEIGTLLMKGPIKFGVKLLPERFRSTLFRKIVPSPLLDRIPVKTSVSPGLPV